MTTEDTAQLMQAIEDNECIVADGLDHAIIGLTAGGNVQVVYSSALIIHQYLLDGMEPLDALEFFEYNVLGGIPGAENRPVFLDDY
tara:strand:- start:116 stop:373 length:258 start_codon:yes stop_codon:yes gene_type:complete